MRLPTPRAVVLALAALALVHAAYASWRQDWTLDERVHLEWSRRLLDERVTERDSAGRFDSKTAFSLVHVVAHRAAGGSFESPGARLAARLPTVLCLGLLFAATWALGRHVFGDTAPWVAVAMVALDPNLVAHGSVATVDVPYALATVLTLWTVLRFARRPTWPAGIALGASLGLAFLAKFSAVLLLPGLAAAVLVIGPDERREWRRGRTILALLLVAATAAAVLCVGYVFAEVGTPLGAIDLRSGPFRRLASALPGLRLPLPTPFLTGIDRSFASERSEWGVVIFGRRFPHGVGYYFAVVWPLKTPLFLLAAQVGGLFAALRAGLLRPRPALFLAVNLALTLTYFSFLFQTQLGFRFILMCVPLVAILAAPGLAVIAEGRRWAPAAALAIAVTLLETAPYAGNPLSFTNAAVQPKRLVFRVLADSNVDWGQNRDKIAAWMAERGIPANRLDPLHALPGTNVFTLNALTGAGVFDYERHRWLRENASPIGHLGHTYLVFELDDALYDRLLDENRRLAPSAYADGSCGAEEAAQLAPGGKVPFEVDGPAAESRVWTLCVSTTRGTDLGLRGFKGGIRVGPLVSEADPKWETVLQDQLVWYRLEPGRHAFRLRQMANRRAWLAAPFSGEWAVRRRGARVWIHDGSLPNP